MSDGYASIEAALDRLVAAARDHLAAIRAADGAPDDEGVWRAYVALNNAAYAYDDVLNDVYGEVTPFDVEEITERGGVPLRSAHVSVPTLGAVDPYPRVVSVRQRRDYRVPSVAALLRVAELGRPAPAEGETYEPIRTVGEAVVELLQSGDGSLAMLDLPELDPLDGVVVVAEVEAALAPDVLDSVAEAESDQPFRVGPGGAVLARMHEGAVPGSTN
ncbi:MAG TPA: hypothetical protein VH561_10750 [Micromonosporaceae bacterium]|jgi:hypothetical protein